MTRLGTWIATAIALVSLGLLAGLVKLALGGNDDVRAGLAANGWRVASLGQGPGWQATRDLPAPATVLRVETAGTRQQRTWATLSVRVPVGAGDILLTEHLPGLLRADGALLHAAGERAPPAWQGAPAELAAVCDVYATDDATARRWLSPPAQAAIVRFAKAWPMVALRIQGGTLAAHWREAPQSTAQVLALADLLSAMAAQ